MLAEDLSEGRQDLVTEVQKVLICRQRHGVLLSDAAAWLSYSKPASHGDHAVGLGWYLAHGNSNA
jgi:hypothetical protein